MKIVIWGINYSPELTGIAVYNTALGRFLAAQGHETCVVSTFPYYPAWEKEAADKYCLYRTDVVDGIPVHRCWHYVPRRPSAWKRVAHELSFVMTSTLRIFFLSKPDLCIVVSPPLLLGLAAAFLKLAKGTPYFIHVQDMQPDAALGLGMIRAGLLSRMLYRIESLAYRHAARVSGICDSMIEAFARKGVPQHKILNFPNGMHAPGPDAMPAAGKFRSRAGFASDVTLAVYSGNIGNKQGAEILLEAAARLKRGHVRIVICGDGAQKSFLLSMASQMRLDNVCFLPLLPETEYREMLVDADICLVTQRAGTSNCFFPSKLLSYLSFGKPVAAVTDENSELGAKMRQFGFGFQVAPGHAQALACLLDELSGKRELLAAAGAAGLRFVEQYEFAAVHAHFEEAILQQCAESQPRVAAPKQTV